MPFPLFVFIVVVIAAVTVAVTVALSSRPRQAALAAAIGAAGLLVIHGRVFFDDFPVDDAFIAFRYSKNLANGLGPDWNSQGHVEGYTSFLWMALLAALKKLSLDILTGARVLMVASFGVTFFAVYRIWRLWADEEPDSGLERPVVFALAVVGLAMTDGVAFWGFSGLETPLFMCLLTAGAYLYFLEVRGARFPASVFVFVALALTRPEGVVAGAVTGAFVLAEVVRSDDRRGATLRAVYWLSAFALMYGAYFLWRYSYYGHLFPNTFYAKVEATRPLLQRGADYVADALIKYYLLAMAAGIVALLGIRRLRWDAAYLLALGAAMLGVVALEGGDSFGQGRFIAPLLPLLYLGGLAGFATLVKRLSFDPRATALAVGAIVAVMGLVLIRGSNNPYLPTDRQGIVEREVEARWFSTYAPQDFALAAWAIGAVSYYSDRPALDLLGLNDEAIAHTNIEGFGEGIAGHEKYNVDYVFEVARPEIILTGDASPGPQTNEQFLQELATANTLPAKGIYLRDPRLMQLYTVRSVYIDGYWFNFLQRRDTLDELQGPGLQ